MKTDFADSMNDIHPRLPRETAFIDLRHVDGARKRGIYGPTQGERPAGRCFLTFSGEKVPAGRMRVLSVCFMMKLA
jgi:hypothetical protein